MARPGEQPDDFDIEALYLALDEERRARGLSWQGVAREIKSGFAGVPATFSASTLSGMRQRRVIEADGVLQMLRWLRRAPQSFVHGSKAATPGDALPDVGPDRILRFDTKALHACLDDQRIERRLTWTQVAAEVGGCNAASLTRLSKGGRTSFPEVMRIVRWLGRPAATFTRASEW